MMEDLEYFWNKEIQKASHFRRGRQDTQEGWNQNDDELHVTHDFSTRATTYLLGVSVYVQMIRFSLLLNSVCSFIDGLKFTASTHSSYKHIYCYCFV
jgi:hypothetical protein